MRMPLLLVAMFGCSGAPKPTPPSNTAAPMGTPSPFAVVEGYVRDQHTGNVIPGIQVDAWLGTREKPRYIDAWATSNESGFYSLEVAPGPGYMTGYFDVNEENPPELTFRAGTTLRVDMTVDSKAIARRRIEDPPPACPSSPPGTIVEGHSTTQRDLDDIVRAVLERDEIDGGAIPDLGTNGDGPTLVRKDVGQRKRLTGRALPSNAYVLRTRADIQAKADRENHKVRFIYIRDIYSDGSCATLRAGGSTVWPTNSDSSSGRCTAIDLYEKRAGTWVFVERVDEICS